MAWYLPHKFTNISLKCIEKERLRERERENERNEEKKTITSKMIRKIYTSYTQGRYALITYDIIVWSMLCVYMC